MARTGWASRGSALIPSMRRALWLRGDLRLDDHAGWAELARNPGEAPSAFFVLDPTLANRLHDRKRAYLLSALAELDAQLAGRLTLLALDPTTGLAPLLAEQGIAEVLTHNSVAPGMRRRLEATRSALARAGITLTIVDTPYAVAPGTLLTPKGEPYRVFTPFLRAWRERALRRSPINSGPLDLQPFRRDFELPKQDRDAGESAALRALEAFLANGRPRYARMRDLPAAGATSQLSTHLHFGTIHPRTILARLDSRDERFVNELGWREFYAHVLHHAPEAAYLELDPRLRGLEWRQEQDAPRELAAWREGRTGYPIVDAGMRELAATGLMHNRVRMITASFLVKDLHVDWRIGARHFESLLVDGDLASNRLNWQWVAGTGTDAAPYFRIFNPVLQSQRFDPEGTYLRRWLPELASLATPAIHAPWQHLDPTSIGYVWPIVDHASERSEALRRYQRCLGRSGPGPKRARAGA